MISVKGASFGRFGGWRRQYPGGSECRSIFLTVARAMPNRLAASRWLRPSTWQASRTRRYRSTVYILPPSISKKDRRLQVAEFHSARGWEIPPLPWTNLSPPFSQERDQLDPAFLPWLPQQRGASSAARLGIQLGQLPAHARLARRSGPLVADHLTREADQDWSEGRAPQPLHHFPDGGSGGLERPVPKNPEAD